MDQLIGLPKAEEFEKLDKISRKQWRLTMLRVFIADMGGDIIREIVAAGKHEWRLQFRAIRDKHSLKQEDVDWIFHGFENEVRRRDAMVAHLNASRSRQ